MYYGVQCSVGGVQLTTDRVHLEEGKDVLLTVFTGEGVYY